ncbi:DUF4893 domain-containing protein [Pelagibacterium sp. 26DY04]|uniref:DUF4893 domain-containing protein n=1 Tax=Pelagibacterium sp. 26DY04 TaxID=2967130 RepID=UPI0028151286|nr:DUF4893 domain-containing protein [Pelagibacterium sp. 26DY04]WMT87239.1 DUF4893 domain-containing protein [Pelagibacterium sp. 26DY04]
MRAVITALIAISLALVSPALAQDSRGYAKSLFAQLHPEDQTLAQGWREGLAARLDQLAGTSEDPEILGALPQFQTLIDAEPIAFHIAELEGDWRMRSLQATELGAFVYPYFPARIYPEGQALIFDKASGSQRHRGMLAQADDMTVFFVGALYYGYEAPRLYSTMMAGEITPEQREFDAVAEIQKIGENHFVMAFAPEDGGRFRLYEIRK